MAMEMVIVIANGGGDGVAMIWYRIMLLLAFLLQFHAFFFACFQQIVAKWLGKICYSCNFTVGVYCARGVGNRTKKYTYVNFDAQPKAYKYNQWGWTLNWRASSYPDVYERKIDEWKSEHQHHIVWQQFRCQSNKGSYE